jgi:bacillolysin
MRSSRALSCVATLTLLLGLGAATTTMSATAAVDQPTSEPDAAAVAEGLLRADAAGPVVVRADDGDTAFVGTLGAPVDAPAVSPADTPVQAATEHLDRYGALFDVTRPRAQLDVLEVENTVAGSHVVKFEQQVDGLPVLGGELAVAVDADGALQSVNGETTEPGAVVPAPSESAAAAVRTAVTTTARTHGVPAGTLTAGPATEWFYDPALVGSPVPFAPGPVWRVEVSNDADIRQLVLIGTATGGVVESADQVADVQAVCDRTTQGAVALDSPCTARDYARADDEAATGDANVDRTFASIADASDFYRRIGVDLTGMIGRAGADGRKIRATVKIPRFANAFWNGREAYFGRGLDLADDVVAHELTHGVVQHTANLFMLYQSGAMNESMADVFGEIIDQTNGRGDDAATRDWLIGEDVRATGLTGAIRNMANPARFGDPDSMRSRRYVEDRRGGDAGGVHQNNGVGNKTAYLIFHGGRLNGTPVVGIEPPRSDPDRGLKTARIYLRALRMLTSGSDYADLGRVLPQACRALAGTGTPAITRADCVQVSRAVKATQLLQQPRVAAAPEAPRCTPRNAASRRLFFDNLENRARRVWGGGRLWFRLPQASLEGIVSPYATSGRGSLFGLDPDPSMGTPAASTLTLRRAVRVPRRGSTFLRFDHARLFEYNLRTGRRARYFDGGRLDYSLNRGRTWSNTAGLRWVNGPRQNILLGAGPSGFRGFGGDSHGYMSSRVDLSRFAGRTVRLRWVVSGDRTVGFFGWWLDDVEAYTCRRR